MTFADFLLKDNVQKLVKILDFVPITAVLSQTELDKLRNNYKTSDHDLGLDVVTGNLGIDLN